MPTLQVAKSVSFKNILVATDFSEASGRALQFAADIAADNDAHLCVVHATPRELRGPVPLDPLPLRLDRRNSEARQHLAEIAHSAALRPIRHDEILRRGSVWEVVHEVAENERADLLVVGTHGRGSLGKLVLGSTAEEIFRNATCPVLTVGPSATPGRKFRKVLYATDFGAASLHALPYAIEFAERHAGELILLHLVSPSTSALYSISPQDLVDRLEADKRTILPKLMSLLPCSRGWACAVHYLVETRFSFPEDGIACVAKENDADLIVVGVRESGLKSHRLAARMPWAIAYELVCKSSCPVLTIRA